MQPRNPKYGQSYNAERALTTPVNEQLLSSDPYRTQDTKKVRYKRHYNKLTGDNLQK